MIFGVVMPDMEKLPTVIIPIFLGSTVLFSLSKISTQQLRDISIFNVSGFYVLRFVLLPCWTYLILDYYVYKGLLS